MAKKKPDEITVSEDPQITELEPITELTVADPIPDACEGAPDAEATQFLFTIWRSLNATAHNTNSLADRVATAGPAMGMVESRLNVLGFDVVDGILAPRA